mgnify:CR=1 FL=1
MESRKRAHRIIAGGLWLVIIVAGALWGRTAYYTLRYRHYEEIHLADGAGRVTFIEYWGEKSRAIVFHGDDGKNAFSGVSGAPPLLFEAGRGGKTYTFLFPGAQSALASGGTAFVVSDGAPERTAVLEMIEDRRARYPEISWERLAPELVPPPAAPEGGN